MRGGGGGMRGGGGGMRGGRGGGMRGALPGAGTPIALTAGDRFQIELTQMGGGRARRWVAAWRGGGGGMRGGGGGGMRGGGGGGAGRGGGGMRGGGGGGRGGGGAAVAARGGGAGAEAGAAYWYYRRPGGATLVVTLNRSGVVTALVLTGTAPYPPGRTARHMGLGNSYTDIVRAYGYPDQSLSQGTSLELTYVEPGVRFRLDGMRVTQITIGAYVPAALSATPAAAPEPEAPGPGMSIDELKGYM